MERIDLPAIPFRLIYEDFDWDGHGLVHQPPRGSHHVFRTAFALFRKQYLANRAPAPVSYDLFDVKQYQGETLKEYISRFGAQVVKVGTTNEPMIVYAFRKGVCPRSFSKSLNRSHPKTFC